MSGVFGMAWAYGSCRHVSASGQTCGYPLWSDHSCDNGHGNKVPGRRPPIRLSDIPTHAQQAGDGGA